MPRSMRMHTAVDSGAAPANNLRYIFGGKIKISVPIEPYHMAYGVDGPHPPASGGTGGSEHSTHIQHAT